MDKEKVRDFALGLGVDTVGFASIDDYQSPLSPDARQILPNVRSMVVFGFRELEGAVESENPRVGTVNRMGVLDLCWSTAFRLGRFLEKETGTKAAPVAPSYPMLMDNETKGMIGDVSLRHAAVAAGLSEFGRHNLVIHPELGTSVFYAAVLSELPFESDPKIEKGLCDDCRLCVEVCPAKALEEEGKTNTLKCLFTVQPKGVSTVIRYFTQMLDKPKEEQIKMIRDPFFWDLYQTGFIGFTYGCFKCSTVCPIGR
ncbi:4Fe-4S binding protein [Bacteroidota bacterium]